MTNETNTVETKKLGPGFPVSLTMLLSRQPVMEALVGSLFHEKDTKQIPAKRVKEEIKETVVILQPEPPSVVPDNGVQSQFAAIHARIMHGLMHYILPLTLLALVVGYIWAGKTHQIQLQETLDYVFRLSLVLLVITMLRKVKNEN